MKPSVLAVAALSLLLTLAMIGLIVAASLEKGLGEGLARVAADLWGITTLVDLGIGVATIGVWICVLERSPGRSIPWLVALLCVGNLATAVYVFQRSLRSENLADIFLKRAESRS